MKKEKTNKKERKSINSFYASKVESLHMITVRGGEDMNKEDLQLPTQKQNSD